MTCSIFNHILLNKGQESSYNAGDPGSIPVSGRSPGEGNGNPLQYSCLGNPMDGGAWRAVVHGEKKSWTQLSNEYFGSLTSPLTSPFPSVPLEVFILVKR